MIGPVEIDLEGEAATGMNVHAQEFAQVKAFRGDQSVPDADQRMPDRPPASASIASELLDRRRFYDIAILCGKVGSLIHPVHLAETLMIAGFCRHR